MSVCDLDRWFNELTHKYLDLVCLAHLHCKERHDEVQAMVSWYRFIKNDPGKMIAEYLIELSKAIAVAEKSLKQ